MEQRGFLQMVQSAAVITRKMLMAKWTRLGGLMSPRLAGAPVQGVQLRAVGQSLYAIKHRGGGGGGSCPTTFLKGNETGLVKFGKSRI